MHKNYYLRILKTEKLCDKIKLQTKKEVSEMVWVWAVLTVVFVVVEAVTVQLLTIWFAVGSVAALVATLLGATTVWQCIIFVTVSLLVLIATRPYVKKVIESRAEPTNADRCIGKEAIVSEKIDNRAGQGQVKIGGVTWTARSEDESVIEADEIVKVKKIEGVKVIVSKIKTEQTV